MFYTIYRITNLVNGKYYIGKHQTKNVDDGYWRGIWSIQSLYGLPLPVID